MITIVSHDAGGAKILLSLIKNEKDYYFCLSGPAKNIFKKKFKNIKISKIKDCIDKSRKILTGTSWPSRFEIQAIILAKKKKIKTISYLDHWIHYKLRFYYRNRLFLPDEIWVGDKKALQIAKKNFENEKVKIKLKKNYYFINSIKETLSLKNEIKAENILYICSPLNKNEFYKNNAHIFQYNEKELLKYFLINIGKFKFKFKKLIIRPHPSEKLKKYKWAESFNKKIVISNSNSLENDIASAKFIFGFNSNPLVISSFCKKKVFNVSPLGAKANILPFNKIKNFKDLIR